MIFFEICKINPLLFVDINFYNDVDEVFATYRRRWLLSVGAYSFSQQENERLTANMRLIGIPLITMGGVIIINAIACEALNKYTIKPTAK